jgi:hypothetical protein
MQETILGEYPWSGAWRMLIVVTAVMAWGITGAYPRDGAMKRTGGPCRAPIEAGDPQAQLRRDVCLPRRGEEETPALAIGPLTPYLLHETCPRR